MVDCEWILEVQDGEDQTDELAQGDHQGDGQRRTLSGQYKHTADADISGGIYQGSSLRVQQ